jgi:3-oxoadipate enol-lactonase
VPYFRRPGKPDIFYEIDDYTDPWKPAPTILLQHGAARSSLFWRAWVPYLSRFYRVLRPDLRGLGRSGKHQAADCGINFQGYRDDLIDLLDHLGIESVHYCGESSAGTLGMVLAAQCPEHVRTLSLVSAPVSMSEEDKTSALGGYANRIEALRNMGCRGWLEASNAGRRFPSRDGQDRRRGDDRDIPVGVASRCTAQPAENISAGAGAVSGKRHHRHGCARRPPETTGA